MLENKEPIATVAVRDLAVDHVAAGFGQREPVDVANGQVRLGDRLLHGVLDAERRRSGQLQQLVGMIRHD